MARHGSLFLLHLREEGEILNDRYGIIDPILNDWIEPNYKRLKDGMRAAALVLDSARDKFPHSILKRTGVFVLRSVLYAECALRGRPAFAMSSVGDVLHDGRITDLFERLDLDSELAIFDYSRMLIKHYLGRPIPRPPGGLEEWAVSWHRTYPMASHLAVQLLTDGRQIGYTSAPAEWVLT